MLAITGLSTLALLAGPALAEPVVMTETQLDNVTAGYWGGGGDVAVGNSGGCLCNTSGSGSSTPPLDLGDAARRALGSQGQDISYDPYSKNGGLWD